MERESFVFYRSFYESISELDDADRLACYEAIMAYAMDGTEPEGKGVVTAMFKSFKPQIDANNRRYANGCKGGKPKDNQDVTKPEPKANQEVTKTEPNDNVNDNDNVNENDNENDKKINYSLIVSMYNDTCVSFPKCTKLSDRRKKAIKARLRTYSPDDFKRLFELAEQSDFLKGGNKRNWSANFDWLIQDANMAKVLDGNYSGRSPNSKIEIDSNFRNFIEQNQVIDWETGG